MAYVAVFAAIALMSLLHELGHAFAARLLGLHITCISVGLGPPFARWQMRGVEVLLCVVPFGGFVRVAELSGDLPAPNVPLPRTLGVTLAGSGMNYVVAAVLTVSIALAWGVETGRVQGLEVTAVSDHAAAQGLRVRDLLVRADGVPLDSVLALQRRFERSNSVVLDVQRGAGTERLQVTVAQPGQQGIGARYVPKPELIRKSFVASLAHGLWEPLRRSATLVRNSAAMLHPARSQRPLSPVGLGSRVAQSGRWDLRRMMSFGALLSVVVGLFNLLPLPGLDGGKVILASGEALVRRKLARRTAIAVQVAGALILAAVWAALFLADLSGR